MEVCVVESSSTVLTGLCKAVHHVLRALLHMQHCSSMHLDQVRAIRLMSILQRLIPHADCGMNLSV